MKMLNQNPGTNKQIRMLITVCFEVVKIISIKYFLPIMNISDQFIEKLFSHPHFRSSFSSFWSSFDSQIESDASGLQACSLNSVVEDISQLIENNFKTVLEQQCSHIFESNRYVMEELEKLKVHVKNSPNLKTQSSTAERDTNTKLETSIFFESESQYDITEIRKHFDEEIENRILTNSFQIDQQDKTYQQIEDKINASLEGSINRIELTLEQKFDKYSAKIQQMIEQLRKTMASVVQAMNQKEYWSQSPSKHQKSSYKQVQYNAFAKKQQRASQAEKQPLQNAKKDMTKQHEPSIKNQQKPKLNQTALQNAYSNSNKAIESLNKSINLGRTKIKSLFGFKLSSHNDKKSLNQLERA